MPPVCSMLEFMGATIDKINRERKSSESSSQEEMLQQPNTLWCQERKNMEFYFKPQHIQNHVDLAFSGVTHFDQCFTEMDVDMIPDADDLMETLMT